MSIYRPIVSVIIPAYNVESCLRQCLESAFAQTVRPDQVILVNDGSTDRTAEVAQSYGRQVVYLEQSNQGQGAARNAGLRAATGEYIAFLDADDYWLPDFLKETTAFLATHSEAVAVNTGHIIIRRGKQHTGPSGLLAASLGRENGYVLESFFDAWARHDHVRTGTVLIRRSAIERAGPQLEIRISQDLEYWGYLATFGPWGFIPKPLWVGDSHAHGSQAGWLRKYRKRRKACPSVEEWEHRIVPRLAEADVSAFAVVRGRVAMGYAQNKILAGFYESAYQIVRRYGDAMPHCAMSKVLRLGRRYGRVSWVLACGAVCLRERSKASRLSLGNWLGGA